MSYDNFIAKNIIKNNDFQIIKVHGLESLKYISFVRDEYELIEALIEKGNLESIIKFREDLPRTSEYLDVMSFKDQDDNSYIITIYDSDSLEQDPQTIKIYKMY